LTEEPFKNNEINLQPGDTLYLFSDGYYDQFGGDSGRKLYTRNFRELLTEIHTLPIEEQKEEIEDRFDAWKGEYRQIDDVLVIGIRIG